MADLVVFIGLVGLVGAAGIALGMLAARRLGAWDDRRTAAGDAVPAAAGSGSTLDPDALEHGGDTGD